MGQVYRNKNCPPGVGAKSLVGIPEPYSTAMSPLACMQKCQSIADCQGIVVEDIASWVETDRILDLKGCAVGAAASLQFKRNC